MLLKSYRMNGEKKGEEEEERMRRKERGEVRERDTMRLES